MWQITDEFISEPAYKSRLKMEIGKRIKEERKKHKLTLQALADRIGTTKSYMWELENTETTNPTLRILVGLSKELNVSIDYLAKGQNQQGSGSTD